MQKLLVIARHYNTEQIFWLGYRCKKCGLRFENINNLQLHSRIHQTIIKKPCEICGEVKQLQTHHISYDPEITKDICASCHGIWHRDNTPNWGTKGCTNFMH